MSEAALVRTHLENELTWRRDEIRRLRNLGGLKPGEGTEGRRRALVVMLYAHLEGFIKFALQQYARSVNDARLTVREAKPAICAAALVDAFKDYRASEPADQTDPHGVRARQVMKDAALLARIAQLHASVVSLDVDAVTSADSNLSTVVLRRNLVLLGLDDSEVHRFTGALDGVLRLRNNIAHGERINLPSDQSFVKLESRTFELCDTLLRLIFEAVRDEAYRA